MSALARRQETPLAELEGLAEEIRQGLAGNPEPAPLAERTPLPPVLQERVAALLRDVAAAQQSAVTRIDALLAGARDLPVQTTYRFDAEAIRFVVVPLRTERGAKPAAPDPTPRIPPPTAGPSLVAATLPRRWRYRCLPTCARWLAVCCSCFFGGCYGCCDMVRPLVV